MTGRFFPLVSLMKTDRDAVIALADRLDILEDPGPQAMVDLESLEGRDVLKYLGILYVNETPIDHAPFTDFLVDLLLGSDPERALAAAQAVSACVPGGVKFIRGLDFTPEQRALIIPFVDLFLAPWFANVLGIGAIDA